MKDFRVPFRYARLSVLNEIREPNLYIVLLSVFFVLQYCFGGISSYLYTSSDKMNVFELYIFFMSTGRSQIIYLIGVILLSCGVLFYDAGAAYYLIRSDRKKWIMSQSIYLLCMTLCYSIFIFLVLCIVCGRNLTLHNEWSNASLTASQFSSDVIGIKPIVSVSYAILQIKPIYAGILTFILSILIGMATGLIMIMSNIRNKNVFAITIIIIMWFADILVENGSIFAEINYLSPFGLSRIGRLSLAGSGPPYVYAVTFLLMLIAVEIYFLFEAAVKVDFIKME